MTKRDTPWMVGNNHARKEETKEAILHIRCTKEQKGRLVRMSRAEGKKLSAYVLDKLLNESSLQP